MAKFRVHLRQRYHVTKAYYFVGFIATNQRLYDQLQRFGCELVFKEVVQGRSHEPKGNVDAHLVLWAMKELGKYDQATRSRSNDDERC